MKVAIAVNDRTEISAHFGRSPAFLIFSVEKGQIQHREIRANDQATHGTGHHEQNHDSAQPHIHSHDHNRFVQLLGDCRAVVGLGMGAGARKALETAGIEVRLLDGPCSPEEAALRFESGLLESSPGVCCGGSGHHHHA
jgi:predicted Fe-Mo cluster-binding NifX family protein